MLLKSSLCCGVEVILLLLLASSQWIGAINCHIVLALEIRMEWPEMLLMLLVLLFMYCWESIHVMMAMT